MKFTLNGREYTIEEFDDVRMNGRNRGTSYYWASGGSEGKCFPSLLEAQQDAIRHAEEEYNAPSDWLDKQTKLFCRE